jgi:hypothetical protein
MDAEKLKSNYFFLFFNFIGAISVWLKAKYPFKSQYKKYVEKYPTQAWLYKTISKAMALYNDIHMFIGVVLGFLFMYLVIGSQDVIIAIQRFGLGILTGNLTRAYRNEKFADNFATMLGYGPDLAVGLTKLEKNPTLAHKTIINNIPVGAHIYNTLDSFRSYLMADVFLIDPHPDLKLRIMDQRKKLEHELVNNKELTPVVRKVIEKQIAQLGDTYETLFTIEEDGVFQDKFALVKMFRFLYYKKLGVEPGKLSIAANINKTKDYDYNNLKLK